MLFMQFLKHGRYSIKIYCKLNITDDKPLALDYKTEVSKQ